MSQSSRHDRWQAGDSYDRYMGRWSRQLAPRFLDWLAAPAGSDWLEIGCGTGALSAAILDRCDPKTLLAIDPSAGFVATAQAHVRDPRAEFQVGDAQALTAASASRDVIVSALALNFIPDKSKALGQMRRVARSGGTIGFYVWDYPGGGLAFVRAFWAAATSLDSNAKDLAEDRRFPECTPDGLTALVERAGLRSVASTAVEIAMVFKDFDDYWQPFTLGGGPAPGYCTSLDPATRDCLRQTLHDSLPRRQDGSIALPARAWAVKGLNP